MTSSAPPPKAADEPQPLVPLDVAPLFAPLLAELLAVLRALSPDEWQRPTLAGSWRVRDVAAHLLDGKLRKLAVYRDGHRLPLDGPLADEHDLARFINGLNASGVSYATRLSPRLLTDLLEMAGHWLAEVTAALPMDGPALFPVSWAGERQSQNWMDTGREYTEHWHHQMQIRAATSRPLLLEPRWMLPLLDFSVRALPLAYAPLAAPPGTQVTLVVHGPTSGEWTLRRAADAWQLLRGRPARPQALVRLAADNAWRLLYNALPAAAARACLQIDGDESLVEPLLRARSVIL